MNPNNTLQNTYTGGVTNSTVPGQQTNQLLASLQTSMMAGSPLSPEQKAATEQAYYSTNATLGALNTPQGRQQYINNTNVGAAEDNYSQLAQQLAAYDKVILQPQYAGQNPGMPTDLPNNPYVTMGNLSYLTPQSSTLPASSGLYNANPSYALTAQINQGNNIVDLLNTINQAISKETARGTNKYSSDLRSAGTLLGSLADILKLNNDLEMQRMSLRAQSSRSSSSFVDDFVRGAEQIKDDFLAGRYSTGDPQEAWGKAWSQLKAMRDAYGLSGLIPDTQLDSLLGGRAYVGQTGWTGEGNAAPEFLQELYLKGRPTAQQNAVPGLRATITNAKSAKNEYNQAWLRGPLAGITQLPLVGPLATTLTSFLDPHAYNYIQNVKGVIGTQVAKGIGGDVGALANKDIERAQNELADIAANPSVGKQRLDKAVMHTTQALMRVTKERVIAINPITGRKVQVDTPEELEQVFNQGYTYLP